MLRCHFTLGPGRRIGIGCQVTIIAILYRLGCPERDESGDGFPSVGCQAPGAAQDRAKYTLRGFVNIEGIIIPNILASGEYVLIGIQYLAIGNNASNLGVCVKSPDKFIDGSFIGRTH